MSTCSLVLLFLLLLFSVRVTLAPTSCQALTQRRVHCSFAGEPLSAAAASKAAFILIAFELYDPKRFFPALRRVFLVARFVLLLSLRFISFCFD